jgi:putative transposase
VNWNLALGKDQTMKRKRHTEEQIIAILKEHEAGMKTADLCRKRKISEGCFYNWKAKYGGLEVSEATQLVCDRGTAFSPLVAVEHVVRDLS